MPANASALRQTARGARMNMQNHLHHLRTQGGVNLTMVSGRYQLPVITKKGRFWYANGTRVAFNLIKPIMGIMVDDALERIKHDS